MLKLAAAVGVLLLIVPASATAARRPPEPVAFWPPPVLAPERLVAEAVRVDSRGGGEFDVGTGVGVGSHAVLTNAHLTTGRATFVTRCNDAVLTVGRIERAAGGVDLAVVVTAGQDLVPIQLATEDPVAGQVVTMIGYPAGERTVVPVRIEGTLRRPQQGTVLRFSPEPAPGQSGGPLVDDNGRLVAIAYAEDTAGGQGLALPVSRIRAALDQWQRDGVPVAATDRGDPGAIAPRTPACG